MKKIVLCLFVLLAVKISAQPSILVTNISTSVTATVTANSSVYTTTKKLTQKTLTFDVWNIGTTKHAYKMKRYDMVLNQSGTADSAIAHFCYGGQCYGSSPSVSNDADTLLPGGSASQLVGANMDLEADLDEGNIVGFSHVKYTVFNTAIASDSLQFSIRYNDPLVLGISDHGKKLSKLDVFPNPAKDVVTLLVSTSGTSTAKVIVINSIGELVYEKNITVSEGKGNVSLNLQNFSSGVYFVQLKEGDSVTTRKLVVE